MQNYPSHINANSKTFPSTVAFHKNVYIYSIISFNAHDTSGKKHAVFTIPL
jgi:hypothetical protein